MFVEYRYEGEHMRKSNEKFIIDSNNVHNSQYDYSKTKYIRGSTKVTITCLIHGDFQQTPNSHLNGQGCPECGYIKRDAWKRKSQEEAINGFIAVHGNLYDYSMVNYLGSTIKVKIICPIHGEFEQTPANHLQGQGCPECGRDKVCASHTKNLDDLIEKSNIIHDYKYDYSLVEYTRTKDKVSIKCPIHGVFHQRFDDHITRGQGCPECGNIKSANSQRSNTDEFVRKAKLVWGNTYDYSLVEYHNRNTKVIIICNIHGEFQQTPNTHCRGSGCPKCTQSKSYMADQWLDELVIPQECREVRNLLGNYVVDGYDPVTKTVYEFHGDYWHGNPEVYETNDINEVRQTSFGELYQRTQNKKNAFLQAGFRYVEMWELEWKQQRIGKLQ